MKVTEIISGPLRSRYTGILGLNPFVASIAASRLSMLGNQLAQKIVFEQPLPRIIPTQMDVPLKEHTFSVKAPCNLKVLDVITNDSGRNLRGGYDDMSSEVKVETAITYENLDTQEIGVIEVPRFHSLDVRLGFNYHQVLNVRVGDVLKKDQVIADSVGSVGDEYLFTTTANICFCSDKGTAEDAILFNEDTVSRFAYSSLVTYVIKVTENEMLCNTWGDEERVQVLPMVGQKIGPDGIIASKRRFTPDNFVSQGSPAAMRKIDHIHDQVYQCSVDGDSEVISLKVLRNHRTKPVNPNNVYERQLNQLAEDTAAFSHKITESFTREQYLQQKVGKPGVPNNQLNSLILRNVTQFGFEKKGITPPKLTDKKNDVAPYTIEVVVRERRVTGIASKITDLCASKGVTSRIVPAEQMPRDHYGRVADICKSNDSIASRNIPGETHEQYISNCADILTRKLANNLNVWTFEQQQTSSQRPGKKRVRRLLKKMLKTNEGMEIFIESVEDIVKFYDLIYCNQERYNTLGRVLNSYRHTGSEEEFELIYEFMEESLTYCVPVMLTVDLISELGAVPIINRLKTSEYAPEIGPVTFVNDHGELRTTKDNIQVAPMAVMALEKDGSTVSASPSMKLQSMRMPSTYSKSDKQTTPMSKTNVSLLALDNTTILAAAIGEEALAELLDRFNNVDARQMRVEAILEHDKPMGQENLINRDMMPYGSVANHQLSHTLAAFGAELYYNDKS